MRSSSATLLCASLLPHAGLCGEKGSGSPPSVAPPDGGDMDADGGIEGTGGSCDPTAGFLRYGYGKQYVVYNASSFETCGYIRPISFLG